MLLVDEDIIELANNGKLIDEFDESCVTNIGYDLRTDCAILINNKEKYTLSTIKLYPGGSLYLASIENIKLDNQTMAYLTLKNSRIRQGLHIEAPIYQPGHYTKVFFRLVNNSRNIIEIERGDKFVTVLFNKLHKPVKHPYDGAFQCEFDFENLSTYEKIYKA